MAIKETELSYPSLDTAYEIRALVWEGETKGSSATGQPRGIIQILHGMAEHIERYRDFAEFCVNQGFIVCGHDHVGHGKSVKEPGARGVIPRNGMEVMIEDAQSLRLLMQERYAAADEQAQPTQPAGQAEAQLASQKDGQLEKSSSLPYIMFGHSMGSFILRAYLAQYGEGLAAAVVCGTGHLAPSLSSSGNLVARITHALRGNEHKSKLLHNLSVGAYSKQIENARTPLDWLSTDETVVKVYAEDPDCGFMFGAGGNIALTDLTKFIVQRSSVEAVPTQLPLLFIAGKEDPVGEKGEGVKRAVALFEETGHSKVTLILYDGMRHEILNEVDNKRVYDDVVTWISKQLPGK